MKLLFCSNCGDVKGIRSENWRKCACGQAGGQYNADGVTATVGGSSVWVFGIANSFFKSPEQFQFIPEKLKQSRRWQWGYGEHYSDVWWGEFPGDTQIFRIESPEGPRLEVTVEADEETRKQRVTVTDEREYIVKGVGKRLETVITPPQH